MFTLLLTTPRCKGGNEPPRFSNQYEQFCYVFVDTYCRNELNIYTPSDVCTNFEIESFDKSGSRANYSKFYFVLAIEYSGGLFDGTIEIPVVTTGGMCFLFLLLKKKKKMNVHLESTRNSVT